MDFTLSKQQQMVQKMYKEFAENEVKPLAKKVDAEEYFPKETVEKTVSPAGLGAVAKKVRQAARLQVRFDARVASETKGHLENVEAAKAWIADGKLHLETTDAFDPKGFTALSVIVTDSEGRMLDALQDSVADHPDPLEDDRFSAWKALAPYITEEMGQNAIFEVTGYKIP